MGINSSVRARARLALQAACRSHLYDPNVTSVDIGLPYRGGRLLREAPAIRFHVARKLSGYALDRAIAAQATAPLPARVGDFETDVLEGRYRPHWGYPWGGRATRRMDPRLSRADPLRGGISVSRDGRYGSGTLGAIVVDSASGAPMILSNWHVLVVNWAARPGIAIYQPGRTDGGGLADCVAHYARDAMTVNLDAAVAVTNSSRRLSDEQLELGAVAGTLAPELGMRVVKSGRTTAVTYGEITGIDGVVRIHYGAIDRVIRRVATIDPVAGLDQVSDNGDSGSLWLEAATRACVALHFAGSREPARALGMEIGPVLEALAVELV